jgi:dTDP-4-dehydrorhamnose 3,5-epimerase
VEAVETSIADVKIMVPARIHDARGFFSEVFNRAAAEAGGLHSDWVQDNHSMSVKAGTLRGLHFQVPPVAQHKLVRVVRGKILDVAVDLRRSSSTFGQHVAVELSADNWRQLLIPIGFAHGFCTLEPSTEVLYKVSAPYSREHDRGLAWNDPAIGIAWPLTEEEVLLSERDRQHPFLASLPDYFSASSP